MKNRDKFVFFHRKWCKEAILDLKIGNKFKANHIFLSGPGGVGKSHVIRIIQSDTIKLLKLSGFFEPDEVIVLLTAPTEVAAFNIGGMTLHSSLMLGYNKYVSYKSLSHDKANTLYLRLAKLKFIIIDEISMVDSNMLLDVHRRLNEILVQPHDVIFWQCKYIGSW
uniref:ATP-dependent DNA helicase n=1 Tax=Amphimedon queenslandica TaxID=400682 RepID=A0A1X7VJB5_AMPQE